MKGSESYLLEFLEASKRRFIIPVYQRNYDSKKANCTQSKGKIILKSDYTFPSPSAAAAMVVGGSSNGWTRWKDAEGKTLSEVYRK